MPLGEVVGGLLEAVLGQLVPTSVGLAMLLLGSVALGAGWAMERWPLPGEYGPAFAGWCLIQLVALAALALGVRGLRRWTGRRTPSTIRRPEGALALLLFGHAGALTATACAGLAREEPENTAMWALAAIGAAAVLAVVGVCAHHVLRRSEAFPELDPP